MSDDGGPRAVRRGIGYLDDLKLDLGIAIRTFVKRPGFLIAVLLTLGIGIGGSVAMFAVLRASLLQALPFPEPERLVMGRATFGGRVNPYASAFDFYDYRDGIRSLDALGAIAPFPRRVTVTGDDLAERVEAITVSTDFFHALGVGPTIGRDFLPEEGEPGAEPVVILSWEYWQRRFGGERSALGQPLVAAGIPLTVVGVMPPGFRFLLDGDIWIPFQRGIGYATARQFHNFLLIGRLSPGATVGQVQAEADRISAVLEETYPDSNEGKALLVTPLHASLLESYRPTLNILTAAVLTLLLVACMNAAGLLMARGSARRAELAVRSVIGAGRGRLMRQLLAENVLLAGGAGVLGILIAVWVQRAILAFVALDSLGRLDSGVSAPLLGFAVLVSGITVFLFGLLPALSLSRADAGRDLSAGARLAGSRRATRTRNGLVVAQVALTAVLLAVASLLLRSFLELRSVSPGFDQRALLTAELQVPTREYEPARRIQFFTEFRERVAAVPGVESVALVSQLPIRDPGNNVALLRPEDVGKPNAGLIVHQRVVMPGYFRAMGIPLRRGRDVEEGDSEDATRVIILSEATAERLFGEEDPIGRTLIALTTGTETAPHEVVGVVGNVVMNRLEAGPEVGMYFAYNQRANSVMRAAIRVRGDPTSLAAAVRDVVRSLDANIPLDGVATMEQVIDRSVSSEKAITGAVLAFSMVALLLAGIGLYGLMAYQVARRLHEFGIRLALGATRIGMTADVLRHGLRLTGIGLAIGVPVALLAGLLVRGFLFGIGSADPLAFVIVAAFLAVTGALASAFPARRAARVDPVTAFRSE